MAVLYTNGTIMYSDMGSPAILDDMTTFTVLALVRIDSLSPAGTYIASKKVDGGATAGWRASLSGTSGQMSFNRRYAADAVNYVTSNNLVVAGTWQWLAWRFNRTGSAGALVQMFAGPYAGAIVEASGYSTATDGTLVEAGASDANEPLRLANNKTGATSITPTGAIERFVIWKELLSAAQINAHIGGTPHTSNLAFDATVGWDGGTAVNDTTAGNNDGTTTTAVNTPGIDQPRIVRAGYHYRNH